MIRSLIIRDDSLISALITGLNLEKITENSLGIFYKKWGWIVVHGHKEAEIQEFLITEFAVDTLYFVRLGRSIDTEHEIGDIILPNIFFEYDKTLDEKQVTEENRDSFISHPQFLEIFEKQKDYYIEDFGLSVGGIAVSNTPQTDENIDESLMMAYAWDIYFADDISPLVSQVNHEKVTILIVGAIIEGKKPSGLKDAYARISSNIITTVTLLEKEDE